MESDLQKQLAKDLNTMMKGLTGMIGSLDRTVSDMTKNMSPEHAKAFAESMKTNEVYDKIEEIKKEFKNL